MPPFPATELTHLLMFAAGVMAGVFLGLIAGKSDAR